MNNVRRTGHTSTQKMLRLICVMTAANMKSRYRNTFYGLIWVLLYPILIYVVQVFAFVYVFKVQQPNYPLYLLAGLIPWIFIVQSVEMSTGIYLQWGHTLKNMPIPPLIIPFIQLLDNFINFFSAYYLILMFYLYTGKISFYQIILSIFPTFTLVVFVTGMCTLFALFNVRFRDLKFVLSFIFTLLFYLTPICYPLSSVPEELKWLIGNNPFYFLLRPFQELFMRGLTQAFFEYQLISFAMAIGSTTICYLGWKRFRNMVVFYG